MNKKSMEADAQNTQEPPPPGDDLNEHLAVQNQLPQLRHQMEHQQCEHQYQMEDIIARQEDLMQQLQYNLACTIRNGVHPPRRRV